MSELFKIRPFDKFYLPMPIDGNSLISSRITRCGFSISTDFEHLCYLLGSATSAKMVLMNHFHPLMILYEDEDCTVNYQPLGCLLKFLCNSARGGSFHTEFRTCCMVTCTNQSRQLFSERGWFKHPSSFDEDSY